MKAKNKKGNIIIKTKKKEFKKNIYITNKLQDNI